MAGFGTHGPDRTIDLIAEAAARDEGARQHPEIRTGAIKRLNSRSNDSFGSKGDVFWRTPALRRKADIPFKKSWDGSSVLPLANDGFKPASTCPEGRIAIVTIGELICPCRANQLRVLWPPCPAAAITTVAGRRVRDTGQHSAAHGRATRRQSTCRFLECVATLICPGISHAPCGGRARDFRW